MDRDRLLGGDLRPAPRRAAEGLGIVRPRLRYRPLPSETTLNSSPDWRDSVIGWSCAPTQVMARPEISRWHGRRTDRIHNHASNAATTPTKTVTATRPPAVCAPVNPRANARANTASSAVNRPSRWSLL
jgi:hypothetical protein